MMLSRLGHKLKALHRDEEGANMVEYILLIAAVALPMLALLIWFRKDIANWIGEAYESIKGGEGTSPDEMQ